MAATSTMLELGTAAPDFSLPDTTGATVSRDDFDGVGRGDDGIELALDQVEQQIRCAHAHFVGRLPYGGKARSQQGCHRNIIEADDADISRDVETGLTAVFERADGHHVIRAQQRGRSPG